MTDLPLIFVGGLLGSAHCVGMCGPLALTLGAASPRTGANLGRQLAFGAGRIFTYAFCGAAAGFVGVWMTAHMSALVRVQAWLALGAGALLILAGLLAAGVMPRLRWRVLSAVPCSAATSIKTMLQAPSTLAAMLAGVFTGFIPCGLVYAFLIKALSTGSPWQGAATMAAFGAGTVPLMTVTGLGASALGGMSRARLMRVAAWSVVLTGIVTVARGGYQFAASDAKTTGPRCPLCAERQIEAPR